MKNLRFKLLVLKSLPYGFLRAIPSARRLLAKPGATEEEKFKLAQKIMDKIRRKSHTETDVYGRENIPRDDNFIIYSNHQGKYDALGILLALTKPCSVLWEKKQASRLLSSEISALLSAVKIDLTDIRSKVRSITEVTDQLTKGRSFLIFPEGGYEENHNNMQPFFSGCFSCALKSEKPIVPVVLYDSYRAMNGNKLGKVRTQVHFLPPVYADEYRHMKKSELSELIYGLINKKLNEIA